MSYQIGDCLLNRIGTLTIPDMVDGHTAQMLLDYFAEHGYEGEAQKTADRLTIAVPRNALDDAQLAVCGRSWADEVNTYSEFVAKLCGMVWRHKRVMPTVSDTDNGVGSHAQN